jgi:small subunit ribosomal protein S17
MLEKEKGSRRSYIGNVISDKMQKTVVVEVTRKIQHPIYSRVVKRVTQFKAHDEKNECRVGDRVRVVETRPLSKEKHFRVIQVIERAKTLEE